MPFEDLPDRLTEVRQRIGEAARRGGHGQDVRIIAVTKTHGPDAVAAAWNAGLEDVGENRVQEALGKMAAGSPPVRWHLIGHLQRNKVKSVDGFFLVHSIDSLRLAVAANAHGLSSGRAVPALVQMNVAGEETKGGFATDELDTAGDQLSAMTGLDVRGVMTMARFGASEAELRRTFQGARQAAENLRQRGFKASELSMGMSGDFEIAVEEGATYVRLGTILFGERE
jgi:pyridoxal phosphate enzyme (YggS family)